MDNDKLFEFMTKMYSEMQQGFSEVRGDIKGIKDDVAGLKDDVTGLKEDVTVLKNDVAGLKSDVKKLGNKIDGEITEKLKILSDEQSIMRKEISEINQRRIEDKMIIQDIKLTVDALYSKQDKQDKKIIELDKKLAK